jgi:hypothetical protein
VGMQGAQWASRPLIGGTIMMRVHLYACQRWRQVNQHVLSDSSAGFMTCRSGLSLLQSRILRRRTI